MQLNTMQSLATDLSVFKKTKQFPKLSVIRNTAFGDFIASERGFNELESVIRTTKNGIDLGDMWQEFQRSLVLWNQWRTPLVNLLSYDVQSPTETVYVPFSEDFEEASEFGEPKGRRLGRPTYMGYDFKWYDTAVRYTWMFLAESDDSQVRAIHSTVLDADGNLMFNKIMKTLFNNVNSTATINEQAVNVYKLYNADGTVPPSYKNYTHTGSHTHYITSGAATINSGDLDEIYDHLYHHGYGVNSVTRMVLLVNKQEGAVIRTFKVASGAKYDFIPGALYGGGVYLTNGQLVAQPQGTVPGEIGTYGPWHVVEEDYIPAGYVVGFVSGGERNIGNLIGIRSHDNSALRGLKLVKGKDADYPLTDSFYLHGFGTGIRHRGAGVVQQITANASYTIPTIYQ